MADSERPRSSTQDVVENLSISNYVRDVPRSTTKIPSEARSILKTEVEQLRRNADRTLQELNEPRPSAMRKAQNNVLNLTQQAIGIAGIAIHQGALIKAIIARIPDELLSSVSIYLEDEEGAARVEREVIALVESGGGAIVDAEAPVSGSWFRRMRALFAQVVDTNAGKDALTLGAQAATSRLVNATNAQNTATLMHNLGPVLTSIERYENVVIRVQALLIVKMDGSLVVHQLTPAQQLTLDRNPELAKLPHEVLPALGLSDDASLSSQGPATTDRPAVRSKSS